MGCCVDKGGVVLEEGYQREGVVIEEGLQRRGVRRGGEGRAVRRGKRGKAGIFVHHVSGKVVRKCCHIFVLLETIYYGNLVM